MLCGLGLLAVGLFAGCQSLPPGAEPGPHGTMAYYVPVNSSPPDAQIEVNGQIVGRTPLRLKIWGDPDGTFHDFGSYYYVVRALPADTNQYPQTIAYNTGRAWGVEDRIPHEINFDMSRKPTEPPPGYTGTPPYPYPPYPYAYPYPYYYGPRIYIGPGYYHRRGWW
jgi:hypothetical protein